MQLEKQLESYFGLKNAICVPLHTMANDAISVTTPTSRFALKLYNTASRTAKDVQWEMDLTMHLIQNGAPIAKPVRGRNGYVETLIIDGQERASVLFEWAPGEKPQQSESTYILLGKAAAQIHQAADSFSSSLDREKYDATELIDEQLHRMKEPLQQAGVWSEMNALGDRMKELLRNSSLDYGVCHMDLTLDNVHVNGNTMTVFDLDSAGESWRANEPHLVLKSSEKYFKTWLEGYRSIRGFDEANERAVYAFVIIGEIRNIVWKLGLAKSSRGKPLLEPSELPAVINGWLKWEETYLQTKKA